MTNEVSNQIELSAVLDLVPYLDIKFDEDCNTLSDIVTRYQIMKKYLIKKNFKY